MARSASSASPRPTPGGKTPAVRDVSLTVDDSEFMVLLGPSGCGKTTLLRMIAGLEYPDAGRIVIGDRDVTDLPPRKRGIAMVFQSYAVFPHLTVFENIAFGLRMQKRAERRGQRSASSARPACCSSSRTSGATPAQLSAAASASAWRWRGRSSWSRRCC